MIAKNLKEWHRIVVERDGYICQLGIAPECKGDYSSPYYFNENGENPHVIGDHLKHRRAYPELVLETTNGKCACYFCNGLRERVDQSELPEGYLQPAIEIPREAQYGIGVSDIKRQTLPIALMVSGKCKKCKKCDAMPTGFCMGCEPWKGPNFKKPKKESKKS